VSIGITIAQAYLLMKKNIEHALILSSALLIVELFCGIALSGTFAEDKIEWGLTSNSQRAANSLYIDDFDRQHPNYIRLSAQDFNNASIVISEGEVTLRFQDGRSLKQSQKDFMDQIRAEQYGLGSPSDNFSSDEYRLVVQKMSKLGILDKWSEIDPIVKEEFPCIHARQMLPSPKSNDEENIEISVQEQIETGMQKLLIYSEIAKKPLSEIKCDKINIIDEFATHAKDSVDFWEQQMTATDRLQGKFAYEKRLYQTEIDIALKQINKLIENPTLLKKTKAARSAVQIDGGNANQKSLTNNLRITVTRRTECDSDDLNNYFIQAVSIYKKSPSPSYQYLINRPGCRTNIEFRHTSGVLSGADYKQLDNLSTVDGVAGFLRDNTHPVTGNN
jgi:hypothetical protein